MGAKQMFRSLREKFLTLPDYVQVWPGHGAGSACGKALGAVPTSTVGYERLFSWWGRYLEQADEEGFVEALLEGQPDAGLLRRMKRQNKMAPRCLRRGYRHNATMPRRSGRYSTMMRSYSWIPVHQRHSKKARFPAAQHPPAEASFATGPPGS